MSQTARQLACPDASLSFGTVTGALDDRFLIRQGSRMLPARRAAGCLLAPELGDRVLLASDGAEEHYVLQVLARVSTEPGRVGLEEGLVLHGGAGPLEMAGETLRLTAGERLELKAPEIAVHGGLVAMVGETLSQAFARTRCVTGSLERIAGRVVERVRRLYRTVEETEHARVGRLRLDVEQSLRMKAGRATLEAEETLQLDGNKIQVG